MNRRKGVAAKLITALANADINLRALSIADTERFGILRMIVSDNKMAAAVLKGKGYIVKETEVVGVKIGDQPGKMAAALTFPLPGNAEEPSLSSTSRIFPCLPMIWSSGAAGHEKAPGNSRGL